MRELMPRYYFDFRNNDGIAHDEHGLELGDIQAVQNEAARSLGDMARDALRASPVSADPGHRMAIEVRDGNGPVLQVRLTIDIDRP
jgi:hypothetical protein